jgi:hypothetical protein
MWKQPYLLHEFQKRGCLERALRRLQHHLEFSGVVFLSRGCMDGSQTFRRLRSSSKSSLSVLRPTTQRCLLSLFSDEQPLVAGLLSFTYCRQRAAPLRTVTLPLRQKVVFQKSPKISPLVLDMLQDFPDIVYEQRQGVKDGGSAHLLLIRRRGMTLSRCLLSLLSTSSPRVAGLSRDRDRR